MNRKKNIFELQVKVKLNKFLFVFFKKTSQIVGDLMSAGFFCCCFHPSGKRRGIWGLFGGTVRRTDRRLEPAQSPAAGPSEQGAWTQAKGG